MCGTLVLSDTFVIRTVDVPCPVMASEKKTWRLDPTTTLVAPFTGVVLSTVGAGAAGRVVNVIVVVASGVPVRLRIADGPPVRVNRYSVFAASAPAVPPKGLTSSRLSAG